jgi:hypothetical protein
MTVKFMFDYVLILHNKHKYITAIERDGIDEETAFKRSLVQINRSDIKSITKMSDSTATIMLKKNLPSLITVENYDEIIDTIHNANLAVDLMRQDKVYFFDEFEVNSDELNIMQNAYNSKIKKM